MSWDTSNRRAELPRDWEQRRQARKALAGGVCEYRRSDGRRCTAPGTDADHAVHRDDHRVESLRWLCAWHHRRKTLKEAEAARKLPDLKRPPEAHPGRRKPK